MSDDFLNSGLVKDDFRKKVLEGLNAGKTISMITLVLGDSGEAKLKFILTELLERFGKVDFLEMLYTCTKELILNSTKAAIKRLEFIEAGANPENPEEYERLMKSFKDTLTDKKFPHYKAKMKECGFYTKIKFDHNHERIIIKIINNFPLLKKEEERIREKFIKAKKYDNLFEFYLEHADSSEGAGMGITMVEILLAQSGLDRHLFTIYSSQMKKETVAKLEIPIHPDYIPKRPGLEINSLQYIARD